MSVHTHNKLAKTSVFTFHDDSLHCRVVLGSSFIVSHAPEGVAGIKTILRNTPSIHKNWQANAALLEMDVKAQGRAALHWQIGCEKSTTYPSSYRAYAHNQGNDTLYHLGVEDNYTLRAEPHDVMDCLPDSVFGVVLGLATGLTEAHRLLLDATKRDEHVSYDVPKSDWRAPRFCYTLRTATGSPFAERWGFALQESAEGNKKFRVWVEQQRTGKEVQLFLRENGDVEGIHDVEALPAAIHGAALGMLIGADCAVRCFDEVPAKATFSQAKSAEPAASVAKLHKATPHQ